MFKAVPTESGLTHEWSRRAVDRDGARLIRDVSWTMMLSLDNALSRRRFRELHAMESTVYIETSIVSYLAARLSRDLITAAHQQLTT